MVGGTEGGVNCTVGGSGSPAHWHIWVDHRHHCLSPPTPPMLMPSKPPPVSNSKLGCRFPEPDLELGRTGKESFWSVEFPSSLEIHFPITPTCKLHCTKTVALKLDPEDLWGFSEVYWGLKGYLSITMDHILEMGHKSLTLGTWLILAGQRLTVAENPIQCTGDSQQTMCEIIECMCCISCPTPFAFTYG